MSSFWGFKLYLLIMDKFFYFMFTDAFSDLMSNRGCVNCISDKKYRQHYMAIFFILSVFIFLFVFLFSVSFY